MRRTIVLTFTAAALLFVAGVALESYGREIFERHRWASGELPTFWMPECYGGGCGLMQSWEKAAGVAWLLALALFIAGMRLLIIETQPRHVSVLRLCDGAPKRVVSASPPMQSAAVTSARADDACPLSLQGEDGLTPLERVIRRY